MVLLFWSGARWYLNISALPNEVVGVMVSFHSDVTIPSTAVPVGHFMFFFLL